MRSSTHRGLALPLKERVRQARGFGNLLRLVVVERAQVGVVERRRRQEDWVNAKRGVGVDLVVLAPRVHNAIPAKIEATCLITANMTTVRVPLASFQEPRQKVHQATGKENSKRRISARLGQFQSPPSRLILRLLHIVAETNSKCFLDSTAEVAWWLTRLRLSAFLQENLDQTAETLNAVDDSGRTCNCSMSNLRADHGERYDRRTLFRTQYASFLLTLRHKLDFNIRR